jgi:hypothetical protein
MWTLMKSRHEEPNVNTRELESLARAERILDRIRNA